MGSSLIKSNRDNHTDHKRESVTDGTLRLNNPNTKVHHKDPHHTIAYENESAKETQNQAPSSSPTSPQLIQPRRTHDHKAP